MNRRDILKNGGLLAAASLVMGTNKALGKENSVKKKPVLTVAHITDVHITPDNDAPAKFKLCLEEIKKHKVDFFLNGGDSIMDASYDNVKREQVTKLWGVWDDCIKTINSYEIHSCIGNHDTWWVAPDKTDAMYGKDYVVKRLNIPNRYYSFNKSGWHFIILDGNNKGITLDDEQFKWLEKELDGLTTGTHVLIMSHYPILGVTPIWEGGQHSDYKAMKALFYKHRDKVKVCLSGHNHLLDAVTYNDTQYFCNGAVSGFWWGKGDDKSAAAYYYEETPPGYAILELFEDGTLLNTYHPIKL